MQRVVRALEGLGDTQLLVELMLLGNSGQLKHVAQGGNLSVPRAASDYAHRSVLNHLRRPQLVAAIAENLEAVQKRSEHQRAIEAHQITMIDAETSCDLKGIDTTVGPGARLL